MPHAPSNNLKNLLIGSLMLAAIALIWTGSLISWNNGLERLQTESRQQLDQFIDHLNSRLARFEFIPQLIAKNQLLVDLLNHPDSAPRIDIANHFLADINRIIGAADTYLMDGNGLTLAASNWLSDRPFVGQNFSFRPYFTEAMQGQPGRYYALGTTSNQRGYYFSYPVTYAAQQLGVIVIKMDLSNIEEHWSGRPTQFIVQDPNGVVFITTRPDWLYRSLVPLGQSIRQELLASRRYHDINIRPLDYHVEQSYEANGELVTLGTGNEREQFLAQQQAMPEAGWSVMILTPLDAVRSTALTSAAILSLLTTLIVLMGYLAWLRYKRRQEHERGQQEAQRKLEQEVSLRTADLRLEVEKHKRTEQVLRETQGELIQTAKLAVLGQMSTSISHELNNPLAAIRSYADNARRFLTMDKDDKVDENLGRIAALTEQMGKISAQLKTFARKSTGQLENVRLQGVLNSAIELLKPQYKNSSVRVKTRLESEALSARADVIQLEQVLINLISNAMNAMEGQDDGEIVIAARLQDDRVIIDVDDTGPGIAEDHLDNIFDPFFTTRKSGLGLGLSISARIIDHMQGELSACNRPEGGARFTIRLLAVTKAK